VRRQGDCLVTRRRTGCVALLKKYHCERASAKLGWEGRGQSCAQAAAALPWRSPSGLGRAGEALQECSKGGPVVNHHVAHAKECQLLQQVTGQE
jgi:hypothetical protein